MSDRKRSIRVVQFYVFIVHDKRYIDNTRRTNIPVARGAFIVVVVVVVGLNIIVINCFHHCSLRYFADNIVNTEIFNLHY